MANAIKTFWASDSDLQSLAETLQKLIPVEGEVQDVKANPKLEKFRKAVNCYYDLYNNGLCNLASSFRHIFGFASGQYSLGFGDFRNELYVMTEAKMRKIVIEAAVEQLSKIETNHEK